MSPAQPLWYVGEQQQKLFYSTETPYLFPKHLKNHTETPHPYPNPTRLIALLVLDCL